MAAATGTHPPVESRALLHADAESNQDPAKPELRRQKSEREQTDQVRMFSYIESLKNLPDDSPIKRGARCFCKYGIKPLIIVIMAYVWLAKQLYKIYKILPMNVVRMVFGVGLCFFGGCYFAAIAAVEAALNLGGEDMWMHLQVCWDEGQLAGQASLDDDKVDANQNQIADVDEMGCNELINHKAKVVMVAVKDPHRLQRAIFALMNVYIAVIATLKFQFARTVAIALGIANMLSLPLARVFGPFLAAVMGKDLNHWVPTIIDTIVKVIAVAVASLIQSYISAFYSGLRGGRMFALAVINILTERGIMDKLPDSLASKPFDPDKSYIDEVIAYPLAAAGFFVQVTMGFHLLFPFNLILFPLTVIEYILRWEIFH